MGDLFYSTGWTCVVQVPVLGKLSSPDKKNFGKPKMCLFYKISLIMSQLYIWNIWHPNLPAIQDNRLMHFDIYQTMSYFQLNTIFVM